MDDCFVREARAEDILTIANMMRQADRDECMASFGYSPLQALELSFDNSDVAFTGLRGPEPGVMFGVCRQWHLSDTGMPWLLGTYLIEENSKAFLRRCAECLDDLKQDFELLENYVDNRNVMTKAWLRWLGFKIDQPVPYGIHQQPFCRFYMEL